MKLLNELLLRCSPHLGRQHYEHPPGSDRLRQTCRAANVAAQAAGDHDTATEVIEMLSSELTFRLRKATDIRRENATFELVAGDIPILDVGFRMTAPLRSRSMGKSVGL